MNVVGTVSLQWQGTVHLYDGGSVSLLRPKLTNLLKSEKTSRLLDWSDLFVPSEPVDGTVVSGGDDNAARILSPAAPGISDTRLVAGLVMFTTMAGSMSREERKDVLSRSVFVLVTVKKESKRAFWADLGVPLRSRIFWKLEKEASPMTRV